MVKNVHLVTCVGVDFDLDILPHFLRHYLDLGILPERFHVTLQSASVDNPRLTEARGLLESFGVAGSHTWIAPYTSDSMWARRCAAQKEIAEPGDWIVSADADEFHEYPEDLFAFLSRCEAEGINCVQGVFIDRLAKGGMLKSVESSPTIWEQFPIEADVIFSLAGKGRFHNRGGTIKLMAFKAHVLPSRGGHRPVDGQEGVKYFYGDTLGAFHLIEKPATRFSIPLRVHHFHWTANLAARLRKRLATPGVSKAGNEYGAKLLAHLDRHGAIDLGQVALASNHRRSRFRIRPGMMRLKSKLRRLERRVRHTVKGPKQ